MKKVFARLLTVAMALVLVMSMSVSAFAFDSKYFSTIECNDYTEEETVIGNSVEAVEGTYMYADENDEYVNNYNVYALEMDIDGVGAKQLYESAGQSFANEYEAALQAQYASAGYSVEFLSCDVSLETDDISIYQYVLIETEQEITDADGNMMIVYQNQAIYPANSYAVYVTVTNYDSAEDCEAVLEEITAYITVEDYCFGEGYDGLTGEELESIEKVGTIIGIVVLVLLILIPVIVIVIIIVAVKSSKKKKAQQAAQQYNPYGYNPNQYNPYGQYTPNGQPPMNNGQYTGYNQPPVNNGQYGQQGNPYTTYNPSQYRTGEQKDPLDLDNR